MGTVLEFPGRPPPEEPTPPPTPYVPPMPVPDEVGEFMSEVDSLDFVTDPAEFWHRVARIRLVLARWADGWPGA